MESTSGLQFNPKNLNSEFNVLIRVNANRGALIVFDVRLNYDPDMLFALGCSAYDSWTDKSFDANHNSKPLGKSKHFSLTI